MYFDGFFQTGVLINFFIPFRRAEVIKWENIVAAKRIPAVQKRDPALPGWNFSHVFIGYNFEELITMPGSQKNGTEFHPG